MVCVGGGLGFSLMRTKMDLVGENRNWCVGSLAITRFTIPCF
ncbi:unnamed protein product [Arabidopsis thaliana]|uniref:At1g69585 n=2 Tax=Arabidopsis thaliana TaxID=3702 RepID=Q8L758_ARATH|nr:unknown protein [Arabidopsis thaliana]AAP21309.1 At1g69585 [Arabidopsis thaliana]BAE99180.1 hypothetical protein [Arabidopsis thaliana]CAD5316758.1 unnamed protein product [Arabidopsis thaliana]